MRFKELLRIRVLFPLIILLLSSITGTYLFNIIKVKSKIETSFETERCYRLEVGSKTLIYKVYLTFITYGPSYTRSIEEDGVFVLYEGEKLLKPTLSSWSCHKVKLTLSIPPEMTVLVSWELNGVLRGILRQTNTMLNHPLTIEVTLGAGEGENKYYLSVEKASRDKDIIVKVKRPTFMREDIVRPYLYVSLICYSIAITSLIILLREIVGLRKQIATQQTGHHIH